MRKLVVLAVFVAGAPALAAEIGQPAPDFALPDLDGRTFKLSELRGTLVVLEWFNPGCPFVQASHTKGTLKGLAERQAPRGVVWLAVNSGGPGRQGYGAGANRAAAQRLGMRYPVLLDPGGQVGHAYGATNTPGLYVIDRDGNLVYRGAIDNSPDGEGEAPEGGKLVDYVSAALDDLRAGRPVAVPVTRPYGCAVKYGS